MTVSYASCSGREISLHIVLAYVAAVSYDTVPHEYRLVARTGAANDATNVYSQWESRRNIGALYELLMIFAKHA
jgi:hypothetical protein